jgi:mycothiol synthase
MGELTTRPYEASDASAVTDLVNAIEVAAGGNPGLTVEDIATDVRTTVRDLSTDTKLLFAPDGSLVACAFTPTPPPDGFRMDVSGGVHPKWRGQGIGRELFAEQLVRAKQIHRAEAPDAPWEVHVGANTEDESALRLYARFGLTPQRYWFEMEAPTGSAPEPDLPEGLRAVTYQPSMEAAVHAAHMEAFTDHWGFQHRPLEDWAELNVRQVGFLPGLSLIGMDGDQIAGYVLSYEHPTPGWFYIGQVGTRRPWRHRGLAAALLGRVLRRGAGAGMTIGSLGVDADSPTGAVGVYERVGFTVGQRGVTYVLPLKD